jgi:hypothetical protein
MIGNAEAVGFGEGYAETGKLHSANEAHNRGGDDGARNI